MTGLWDRIKRARWAVGITGLIAAVFISDIWLEVDYRVVANTFMALGALLLLAFTLLYGVRSRWRASRIGPIYLVKCVLLTAFLIQAAVAVWLDTDYPGRQQIRFIIYAATALVYVPFLVTLWREQQRDRNNPPL